MDVIGRASALCVLIIILAASADAVSDGDVRLRAGRTKSSGRVEVYHQRRWGTVCDDYFDTNEATVICRQLGYSDTKAVVLPSDTVTDGSGKILLDDLGCGGHESRIIDCSHRHPDRSCSHSEDAGVECDAAAIFADMRLVGMADWNGRIELRHGAAWQPICATGFDRNDAMVACRTLGFDVNAAITTIVFGRSNLAVTGITNLNCIGNETSLYQCEFNGPYASAHRCAANIHAGIKCIDIQSATLSNMKARLNGGSASSGRLEISVNGMWGTVCSRGFHEAEARVACRMVGLPSDNAIAYNYGVTYQVLETEEMWLSNVTCNGTESSLLECGHLGLTIQDCNPREDVGVYCRAADSGHGPHHHHDIRLAGRLPEPFNVTYHPIRQNRASSGNNRGRIEVEYLGIWGTVCDDGWTQANTNVACRTLGLPYERAQKVMLSEFGRGSGPTWLDNVVCTGRELSLFDCQHAVFGQEDCSHSQDVAIVCE